MSGTRGAPDDAPDAPAAALAASSRGGGAGRWIRPVLGLVIAGTFFYLGFRRLDWGEVRDAWRSASPALLALGLCAFALAFAVRIARWWWMLRAIEPTLPMGNCARPYLASIAVNNTVPLRAGDFVRAFGFRHALRVPPAQVLGTLVVERVLDMIVLLTFFFVGLLGVAGGIVAPAFVRAGTILFALCLCGLLVLVLAPRLVELLVARVLLGPLAGRAWTTKIHGAAEQFFAALARVLTPARAAQLLLLSVLSWGLEGGLYAAVAAALHTGGRALGPWFAFPSGTLATLIPSSPGYVGTFDVAATVGLMAYGASRTAASAFALLVHVCLWLPSTIAGGISFISMRGRRSGPARAVRGTGGELPDAYGREQNVQPALAGEAGHRGVA